LAQISDVNYTSDEIAVLLHLVTGDKLEMIDLTELSKFKLDFLAFYRKIATPEFRQKCDKAKDVKEIDGEVTVMLERFLKQRNKA